MVPKVVGPAASAATQAVRAPQVESFKQVLQSPQAQRAAMPKPTAPSAKPVAVAKPVALKPDAQALLQEVTAAQGKLDALLKLAESGRTFSPAELIVFQAHTYRATQELELAGKVVENATSGIKQTLNTQV